MALLKVVVLSGQAGAIRHGISKALKYLRLSFRPALKKVGFINRDSRVVERKKSGLAKARRSYQILKKDKFYYDKKVSVAVLGSTGFVGLELIKILSKHPKVLNCLFRM